MILLEWNSCSKRAVLVLVLLENFCYIVTGIFCQILVTTFIHKRELLKIRFNFLFIFVHTVGGELLDFKETFASSCFLSTCLFLSLYDTFFNEIWQTNLLYLQSKILSDRHCIFPGHLGAFLQANLAPKSISSIVKSKVCFSSRELFTSFQRAANSSFLWKVRQ